VSLGKLAGQGWDVRLRLPDAGMELQNRDGDMLAGVGKVNNIYPMGPKVIPPRPGWLHGQQEREREPTHEERLETVAMVATARGAEGTKAALLTWHRRLGHPSFKTVVALSESGANGMGITDPSRRCRYSSFFPLH
jgi:hypothetical protein